MVLRIEFLFFNINRAAKRTASSGYINDASVETEAELWFFRNFWKSAKVQQAVSYHKDPQTALAGY